MSKYVTNPFNDVKRLSTLIHLFLTKNKCPGCGRKKNKKTGFILHFPRCSLFDLKKFKSLSKFKE